MDMEMDRYLLAASPPEFFLYKAAELEGFMFNNCIGDMLAERKRSASSSQHECTDDIDELDVNSLEMDLDDDVSLSVDREFQSDSHRECAFTDRFAALDLNVCVGSPRAALDLLDMTASPESKTSSGTVNITVSGRQREGFDIGDKDDSTAEVRIKKKVSFADEMGDRLATYCYIPPCGHTEYIHDDPYYVLSSFAATRPYSSPFTSSFYNATSYQSQPTSVKGMPQCVETVHTICSLGFDQPSSNFSSFLSRLDGDSVCLENAKVEDSNVFCSVRVKNVAFEKSVRVRVTYDNWRSYVEVKGRYVPCGLSVPMYDTFSFQIDSPPAHTLQARGPRNAEFAICYTCNGKEHWDNNKGNNYKIMWMPRQRYSRPA